MQSLLWVVQCDREIPATPLSCTRCNAQPLTQLQLNLVTVESLANASPAKLKPCQGLTLSGATSGVTSPVFS